MRRLAAEKSAAAQAALQAQAAGAPAAGGGRLHGDRSIVLGADTAVVVDGEILGKPRDDDDAARDAAAAVGRRIEVLTGVSLRQGAYEVGRVETTVGASSAR